MWTPPKPASRYRLSSRTRFVRSTALPIHHQYVHGRVWRVIGGQISWVGAVQQAQAPERPNTTAQVRNPRLASWRVRLVVAAFIFDFWVNPVRQEHAARVQSCGFSTCVPMALSRLPGGVGPGQCPILATLERQCGLEVSLRQVRGGTVPGPARKQSFSFHAREGGDQWRRAPARVVAGAAGAVHLTTRFSVDRKSDWT